jgi:signal transduction histidine kinase
VNPAALAAAIAARFAGPCFPVTGLCVYVNPRFPALAATRRASAAASIVVTDEGNGIPEGELEAVFDKFVQSSATRSGAGGTGLGLSICREIVDQHGGRIWADNGRDGGAVFQVMLPCQPAATDRSPRGALASTD